MRMNIQVDLKEQDFLEKQVVNEARGIARGLARGAMNDELGKEMERLVDAKIAEAQKSDYYNRIANNVTKIVAAKISNNVSIDSEEIDKLVTEKVEDYLNKRVSQFGGIEKFIQNYINQSIKSIISNSIKQD